MVGGNQHKSSRWRSRASRVAAALLGASLPVAAVAGAQASTSTDNWAFFDCTPSTVVDSYQVPAGIRRLAILAGGGSGATAGGRGGKGALVRAVVPVKPGETLAVVAGCQAGGRRGGSGIGAGGDGGRGFYNGGGGGGGSAIMRREGFVVDPLVVAGGGGGGGGGAPLVDPGDGGHGSGANAGNREKVTADGASGDKGVQDFFGSFYSNGGGGGGGGFRGGRGGADSSTIFDGASGGRGGSSWVTSAAELGSQIVGGGAPHGSGFVIVVPLTVGQPRPTLLAFGCRPDRSIYDSFTVPAGATQMITVAKGGAGGSDGSNAPGGRGATVEGVLSAVPGAQYRAKAGCAGDLVGGAGYGSGGEGGDNDATTHWAAPGGGGSAVLTLNWRALTVAGGGGGGAGDDDPLSGGGSAGGDGSLAGEPGEGISGGAGGARDSVHGGDGGDCFALDGGTGGGGGAGLRGGRGGRSRCQADDGDGGGGGGGSSLQPGDGRTTTAVGPRTDGLVVVALTT